MNLSCYMVFLSATFLHYISHLIRLHLNVWKPMLWSVDSLYPLPEIWERLIVLQVSMLSLFTVKY